MEGKNELMEHLVNAVGRESCGVSCEEDAEIFYDEAEGWKLMMGGFMESWSLGKTVPEAKEKIDEYASMGFGLS